MKKYSYNYRLLAIAALILILTAGGTAVFAQAQAPINPLFRHLPPNAQDVYHINLPVLTSKVSWEELTGKLPFLQKAGDKEKWAGILKDPSSAGIDIHQDIFFTLTNGAEMDSTGYTTIILHLSDSGKFVSSLREEMPGLRFFNYPGKGRGAGKDQMGVAWNKDLAIITIVRPSTRETMKAVGKKSGAAHPSPTPPAFSPSIAVMAVKQSLAALHGFDGSFYTTDPVFTSGFSDDADMHIWAAQGAGMSMIMKNMLHTKAGSPAPGMAKDKKQLLTLSALRFDAGKITMRSTTNLSPELIPLFAKFNSRPLNTDLLARIPPGNILGMVNLHFDLSAILAVLDKYKVRNKVDSGLAAKGLTLDDIQRAFKGDFLLAAMQPAQQSADSASTEHSKQPDLFFITTIGDGHALRKVADLLKVLKDTIPGDTEVAPSGMKGKLKHAYTLQDNILVVSRNKRLTDSYFSNTEKRSTGFVTDRMKDNPFSLFIDFRTVAAFLGGMSPEPSEKNRQLLHILQSMDRLTFTIGGVTGIESESMFELKMADPSENSLRSLFKLMQ